MWEAGDTTASGLESTGRSHRLFLAVSLGDKTNAAIGAWAKTLIQRFGDTRVSWVDPSLYHLTLHFFGDVTTEGMAAIAKGLEPLAGKVAAPLLSIVKLDYLPSTRRPRVLCLGFRAEPEESLATVIGAARRLAARLGMENDGGPWRAHLTLARLREPPRELPTPPHDGRSGLAGRRIAPTSFDLMESYLSPRGPRYEVVWRFPFAMASRRAKESRG